MNQKIKNRKVDVEAAVEHAQQFDPATVDMVRAISLHCINVTDDDRCEAAVKIYRCGLEAATARGFQ